MNPSKDQLDAAIRSAERQMVGVRETIPTAAEYREEMLELGCANLLDRYEEALVDVAALQHALFKAHRELRGTRRVLNCLCVVCALLIGLCGGLLWSKP